MNKVNYYFRKLNRIPDRILLPKYANLKAIYQFIKNKQLYD